MTKSLIATLIVLASGSLAHADRQIADLDPSQYTCAQAREALRSQGAALILTRWGYEVHYADQNHCGPFERPDYAFVRTLDRRYCGIGYTCEPRYQGGR